MPCFCSLMVLHERIAATLLLKNLLLWQLVLVEPDAIGHKIIVLLPSLRFEIESGFKPPTLQVQEDSGMILAASQNSIAAVYIITLLSLSLNFAPIGEIIQFPPDRLALSMA